MAELPEDKKFSPMDKALPNIEKLDADPGLNRPATEVDISEEAIETEGSQPDPQGSQVGVGGSPGRSREQSQQGRVAALGLFERSSPRATSRRRRSDGHRGPRSHRRVRFATG